MSLFPNDNPSAPKGPTYVPLYKEPKPIPPIDQHVSVPWRGGSASVPTLESFMRQRVTALLGYTSTTLYNSRAYRALQTGWNDGEDSFGLFPRPDDYEREMILAAQIHRGQYSLDWSDADIKRLAAENKMLLELWLFDALNYIHQESDRGATKCMPTTPPPPAGYIVPPITSGPGYDPTKG